MKGAEASGAEAVGGSKAMGSIAAAPSCFTLTGSPRNRKLGLLSGDLIPGKMVVYDWVKGSCGLIVILVLNLQTFSPQQILLVQRQVALVAPIPLKPKRVQIQPMD